MATSRFNGPGRAGCEGKKAMFALRSTLSKQAGAANHGKRSGFMRPSFKGQSLAVRAASICMQPTSVESCGIYANEGWNDADAQFPGGVM